MRIIILLLLLASCAEIPQTATAIGPPPTRDQCARLINEYIHTAFVDPYSVQDLVIEPPVQEQGRWRIYFSCNSKNRMGGYIGHQRNRVNVRNGAIDWPAQQNDAFWQGVAETVGNG